MNGDDGSLDREACVLADSLLAAVGAVIEYLSAQGVTQIPESQYEAHWMEPVPGHSGSSSGKTRVYVEPRPGELFWRFGDQIRALPAVAELDSMLMGTANRCSGFPPSSWLGGSNPIAPVVLQAYFAQSRSLVMDPAAAKDIILSYCRDLAAPTITARHVFQVRDFRAPFAFDLDREVRFRPITVDDIKEQARGALLPFPYLEPWLDTSDWVCEVNKRGPRGTFEAANWRVEGQTYIVTTLALASPGAAHLVLLESRLASPFFAAGRVSSREAMATGRGGGSLRLDDNDISVARELYPKVVSVLAGLEARHLRLGLERLRAAAQRRQPEDQLVDYVIGLESLLSPDSERLETTIRFRLRGAAILPPSFGNDRERTKLMNKLYEVRSKVVHGGANAEQIRHALDVAENALRYVLRWYMTSGRWGRDPCTVVQELDEAMVAGGSAWAHP